MSDDFEFKMERGKLIERARLEKGWTKKQLAERAGYDEKTLYNLLSGGDVQTKTLFDFCQALGMEPPRHTVRAIEISSDALGGYARSTYDEYEGYYHVFRPSFVDHRQIYKCLMKISWDEQDSHFRFLTYYKRDPKEPCGAKTHGGPVSISAITNLVHFVVTFRGSVRLVTVTKLRKADGLMRGSMATHVEDLNFFRPTLSPILIHRIPDRPAGPPGPEDIGMMGENDADWGFVREQLDLTETHVLNLCFRSKLEAKPLA